MGSPEPPETDNHENHLRAPAGVITPAATVTSDESDNEAMQGTPYDGYQQLSAVDFNEPDDEDESDDDEPSVEAIVITNNSNQQPEPAEENSNNGIPNVQTVDAEVEGMVWNAPRPQELTIELDENRREQIVSAMSRISLPPSVIPEWARGDPEEKWKEDLLQSIRKRQN